MGKTFSVNKLVMMYPSGEHVFVHVADLKATSKVCDRLLKFNVNLNSQWDPLSGSFLSWDSIVVCKKDCYRYQVPRVTPTP